MIRTATLISFVALASAGAFAQVTEPRGVCGTGPVDEARLRENIAFAKEGRVTARSRETTYIPVRFKLFGRSDSTGVATANSLLNQMAAINVDFAPLNLQFFLADGDGGSLPWDVYFDDALYSDSRNQTLALRGIRASNAISIYVPDDATPPGNNGLGTTLGYYSRAYDWLVFKRSEVGENASTASHEFGHYFGLPHTFRGWDCTSWSGESTVDEDNPVSSPVDTFSAPCFDVPVELVTREFGANCAEAGDLFCDTPADYNLGFGYGGCDYVGGIADANGDTLAPAENNFMGYFIGCNPYQFSEEQKAAMFGDLASKQRDFLRRVIPRTEDFVTGEVEFIRPAEDNALTTYADIIELEWEPVENAEYYLVQVATSPEFNRGTQEVVLPATQTSHVFGGLRAGRRHFYRVRPFNQVSFGVTGTTRRFESGDRLSGINVAAAAAAASVTVLPNPAPAGGDVSLRLVGAQAGRAHVTVRDLTGRILSSEWIDYAHSGVDYALAGTNALPRGAYLLTVANDAGFSSEKFVVE